MLNKVNPMAVDNWLSKLYDLTLLNLIVIEANRKIATSKQKMLWIGKLEISPVSGSIKTAKYSVKLGEFEDITAAPDANWGVTNFILIK